MLFDLFSYFTLRRERGWGRSVLNSGTAYIHSHAGILLSDTFSCKLLLIIFLELQN